MRESNDCCIQYRKRKTEWRFIQLFHYRKLVEVTIHSVMFNWYKSTADYLGTQPTKFWKYSSFFRRHCPCVIRPDVSATYVHSRTCRATEAPAKHLQSVHTRNTSSPAGCLSSRLLIGHWIYCNYLPFSRIGAF
jgi:hypothetical protein